MDCIHSTMSVANESQLPIQEGHGTKFCLKVYRLGGNDWQDLGTGFGNVVTSKVNQASSIPMLQTITPSRIALLLQ